jgi:hypothetical protein
MAIRERPLWGNILGGNPIERCWPHNDPIYGGPEKDGLDEQFKRMCRLKEHYGISGWGWYKLALALASELDRALTIVDPSPLPTGKTAKRWAGAEGKVLVMEIECMKAHHLAAGKKATVEELLAEHPRYRDMDLDSLKSRYFDALRHHSPTHRPGKRLDRSTKQVLK